MADQGQSAEILWSSEARLELLGTVRLDNAAGDDLTPKARKTRALIALVALAKKPVSRSTLIGLLWGDRGEEQAKASLRQALYELRGLAGSGYLIADRESVGIGPKKLASDHQAIVRHIANRDAGALAEALDAIALPLLGGLDDITPELDDWLREERSRLATCLAEGTRESGEAALSAGDFALARRLADQLERLDPLDERAAQFGIRADLAAEERAAATRRHERFASRLKQQLDIAPSAETAALLSVGHGATQAPVPPSPAIRTAPSRPTPPRRRLLAIFAVLALLAAVAAIAFWLRPASPTMPTVAVLPFDDVGQKDETYFASGVSDEILNLLSRQQRIKVLGRVSAAQLADPASSLATARRLGVGYLLDGSVRMAGTRVLVIARLTRVADGEQIWSERYERSAGDIFAVQGEIAGAVAARMARSLGGARPQETSPEVYDRYLAARQLLRERREVPLEEAERLLREAIARDANYAPAYAELAQVIMLRADHPTSYGPIPLAQARAQAGRLARRAVQLDPNLGDGYAAIGFLSFSLDARSEPYMRKAVQLSPQRTEFHRWHAQTLMAQDRFDEGIAEFKRAVEIDPLWGLNYDHLTGALYLVGREDEARAYARRFLALSTDQRAKLLVMRGMANLESRHGDELRITRALHRLHPEEKQLRFNLASSLSLLGERDEAFRVFGSDPVAAAVLARNWPDMAAAALAMGPEFWDRWGFWNLSNLLLATGRGNIIVKMFDRDRALIESGAIEIDHVASPELVIALRQAGRRAEADRFLAMFEASKDKLPDIGMLKNRKAMGAVIVAALRGDRERALQGIDKLSRERPLNFLHLPAISLRHEPSFASLVGDPRLEAADERLRTRVNSERAKASLAPISRAAWISDPKALLTKN